MIILDFDSVFVLQHFVNASKFVEVLLIFLNASHILVRN